MAQDLILRPAGLWTNPSAYSAAPPGGLKEALNVAIRRPGIVEPRPGFSPSSPVATYDLDLVWALIDYPGTGHLLHVGDPSPTNTAFINGSAVTEPDGSALEWTRGRIFGAASRKNLYLTTSDAVRKLTGTTAGQTAARAGTPPPFLVIRDDTTTGGTVPQDTYYSYRAVKVRKDVNGVEVRSAPSNRVIYGNLAALARSPELRIFGHQNDDNDADVEIWEIYRSFASTTVNVPDEHFFLRSFGPQPSDTNFTERFTDRALDSELGAPLYTNDDEEGLENANYRPPQAKAIAEFNGSVVLGDLTFPASINLTYQYTSGLTAADAAGIGERDLTGTYTNGGPTVTGVADTTGFKVGMIVVDTVGEWGSPATGEYTRITSKTANSVTFSQVYTGATGAKTRVVCDSIRVNARYFPVRSRFELGVHAFWSDFSDAGEIYRPSTDVYALTEDVSIALRDVSLTWSGPVNRTLFLEAILPTEAPFTVYATHGSEYDPPLPEPDVTGTTVTQETAPSGIMWSKAREPEHFSFIDFERIGGDLAQVWRLLRGGDGLWIMKQDGIHRMSGADRDSGFRFDRVSSSRILHPNAACESGDRAFAWCDQGLLSLTSGVTEIPSLAIANRLRPIQNFKPQVANYGVWMAANTKANELILARPVASNSYVTAPTVHVHNLETGTWVEWSLLGDLTCAAVADAGSTANQLIFGLDVSRDSQASTFVTLTESSPISASNPTINYDGFLTPTCTVVGTAVTITAAGGYVPRVGDLIVDGGGSSFFVSAVEDSTHFTVDRAGLNVSSITAYNGHASTITVIAQTAKNPSAIKLWGDGSLLFGRLEDLYDLSMTFSSSAQTAGESYELGSVLDAPDGSGRSIRFIVPRACARSEQLFIALNPEGVAQWQWEGLNLSFKPMSLRTRS